MHKKIYHRHHISYAEIKKRKPFSGEGVKDGQGARTVVTPGFRVRTIYLCRRMAVDKKKLQKGKIVESFD